MDLEGWSKGDHGASAKCGGKRGDTEVLPLKIITQHGGSAGSNWCNEKTFQHDKQHVVRPAWEEVSCGP